MRKLLLFLLVSIALPALAQNGKKVYADFHGVRYTRQHDGKLGRWEMYANTEKSSTGRKSPWFAEAICSHRQKTIWLKERR